MTGSALVFGVVEFVDKAFKPTVAVFAGEVEPVQSVRCILKTSAGAVFKQVVVVEGYAEFGVPVVDADEVVADVVAQFVNLVGTAGIFSAGEDAYQFDVVFEGVAIFACRTLAAPLGIVLYSSFNAELGGEGDFSGCHFVVYPGVFYIAVVEHHLFGISEFEGEVTAYFSGEFDVVPGGQGDARHVAAVVGVEQVAVGG